MTCPSGIYWSISWSKLSWTLGCLARLYSAKESALAVWNKKKESALAVWNKNRRREAIFNKILSFEDQPPSSKVHIPGCIGERSGTWWREVPLSHDALGPERPLPCEQIDFWLIISPFRNWMRMAKTTALRKGRSRGNNHTSNYWEIHFGNWRTDFVVPHIVVVFVNRF